MSQPTIASNATKRFSLFAFLQKRRNTVVEIISALFILLFVYTAVSKLFEFNSFKYVLGKSPLIGNLAPVVAIALPAVELLVSLLLFIPFTRKWGLYSSFALMAIFTIYIGYMLIFTPDRPCSCGGVFKNMGWKKHLIFNIGCTLLSFWGIILERQRRRY